MGKKAKKKEDAKKTQVKGTPKSKKESPIVAVRDITITAPANHTSEDTNFYVFKDGLYYPFIDISDEAWLKTAALYWDSLTTIVPEGFHSYRDTDTSRAFSEAGFLNAEFVDPSMGELDKVADDCMAFLDSPEGLALVASASGPRRLDVGEQWHPEAIHHNKLVQRVLDELRRRGLQFDRDGHWVRLPGWFARYYMTLLASRLSRGTGRSMLTNDTFAEPLANRIVRGDATRHVPADVAQGILSTLVLQTIHIGADTPPKKLLQFKEKHADELGMLRSALRELVKPITGEADVFLLRKHLDAVYSDRLLPSINQLREKLDDNRISCGYNNLRASTLLSASPTALGAALSTTSLGPFGLIGGIGISLLLSIGNYRMQKREILRSSPYSYVVLAEQQLGMKK